MPACCNDDRVFFTFCFHPGHDTFNLSDIAENNACLHGTNGVPANNIIRARDFYPGQFGCSRVQGFR